MNEKFPLRFFVVTFLWSWIIWLPFFLAGLGVYHLSESISSIITMPLVMLGAFGPAVGTFYSLRTLKGKGEVRKFLKSFLSFRFGWKVWTMILLVIGGINIISWYIPEFFDYDRLSMLLPNIYIFPLYFIIMVFLGGGQEEIGWRAYILPFLESKFGIWIGNIILGLVWAGWHIPLWFLSGASQVYMPFIAFAIGCIGLSFFFSWVIKASGGRPLSVLIAHGAFNSFMALFPTLVMQHNVIQVRFWIHEVLILVVGSVFMLITARRLRKLGYEDFKGERSVRL